MKLLEPKDAYVTLWKGLKGDQVSANQAERLLVDYLSTPSTTRKPCVVLMDELDLLVTKKQSVVYNFFDWPNLPHSKLIVVAIANTMDLPERMLTNKVSSRLGLNRLVFHSYKHAQLIQIVESRLKGLQVFTPDAVEYCARRVGQISGDARRCLDICRFETFNARRAIELFNVNPKTELVGLEFIDAAIKEMSSSKIVRAIQYSSLHQRLFLLAITKTIRKTGINETYFCDVVEEHESICRLARIEIPSTTSMYQVCSFLARYHLILMEPGKQGDPSMKLVLQVEEGDVFTGLKNSDGDDRVKSILKSINR